MRPITPLEQGNAQAIEELQAQEAQAQMLRKQQMAQEQMKTQQQQDNLANAQIGGAGIQAGASLLGGLMQQQANRASEQRQMLARGTLRGLDTQLQGSVQNTDRQQAAMGRLMENYRKALIR